MITVSNTLFLEGDDLAPVQFGGNGPSCEAQLAEYFDKGYALKVRREAVCDECGTVVEDPESHDGTACAEALADRFE